MPDRKRVIVGIDFDGTIVEHRYPKIGLGVPGAITALREAAAGGAVFILWTMRSGPELDEAVAYLGREGIALFGVNENPEQRSWTSSPKADCHIYIDDLAIGCPLEESIQTQRPRVNWSEVGPRLLARIAELQNAGANAGVW